MRVVVAGGAGFLGSHLCVKLLSLGHQVCCLDNLITGKRENIQHLETNRDFEFHFQDLTRYIEVNGHVDAVLNFASPASPRDYLRFPIQTLKVGALGTHNSLGLAKAKHARFLLASTSEVYGDPKVNPQPEDYWGNVNPIGQRSVYDEAKRFAEALTEAYHRVHLIDTRIARIFNTYGPQMRSQDGRVISNFIVQALRGQNLTVYGDGNQTRSFCYVSDIVEGLMRLLLADPDPDGPRESSTADTLHAPVNLGNPVEMKVMDIAQMIIRLSGSCSQIELQPLPPDDPKVRCPDVKRAQTLLGWQPRISLEEGLGITLDYFRQAVSKQPSA
jgi:dTDP-glucose 4,6-dehydratase